MDEDGGDGEVTGEDLGVEKTVKKKLKGESDEVEGEKKGKKRKTDVVLNDDQEAEAKGTKKKGNKGGNAKEGKRAGDEEDGDEQNVGSEVSKDKIKKKKMRGDAVVASVGAKNSKPNKKKGADKLVLNDELGVEKKVGKGAKAKDRKGVGDDEDFGVETGVCELSEKRVKKTKKVEDEVAILASGGTKKNKPKN